VVRRGARDVVAQSARVEGDRRQRNDSGLELGSTVHGGRAHARCRCEEERAAKQRVNQRSGGASMVARHGIQRARAWTRGGHTASMEKKL
jgi:hypothetical protein